MTIGGYDKFRHLPDSLSYGVPYKVQHSGYKINITGITVKSFLIN